MRKEFRIYNNYKNEIKKIKLLLIIESMLYK